MHGEFVATADSITDLAKIKRSSRFLHLLKVLEPVLFYRMGRQLVHVSAFFPPLLSLVTGEATLTSHSGHGPKRSHRCSFDPRSFPDFLCQTASGNASVQRTQLCTVALFFLCCISRNQLIMSCLNALYLIYSKQAASKCN